jgi:6-phosphogluconolactonase
MTVAQAVETRTFPDVEVLAQGVAEWLCSLAQASGGRFGVCLSGGSTPRRLYETLATPPVASRFPWARAHWFWGDERFVPHDDPASNFGMVRQALFSRVSAPIDNIHPILTQGLSPDQSADAYEAVLKAFYGAEALTPTRPLFDVTLLGVGDDGHTASLFPGEPSLKEARHWVVAVDSAKYGQRITLTYPTLDSSREVAFLVAGEAKREVVARVRAGDSSMPAALVRPIGRLHWFGDCDALPVGAK